MGRDTVYQVHVDLIEPAGGVAGEEGNLVWVESDETVTTEGEKESSHEYRVLIKTGGAWK